jgi:hypothetical protein
MISLLPSWTFYFCETLSGFVAQSFIDLGVKFGIC